jgi:hypothetical protein
MDEALEGASDLRRDLFDPCLGAVRQAQTFEAAAYLAHADGMRDSSADFLRRAEETWIGLRDVLSQSPDLSLVSSARELKRVGELSAAVEDSLWTLGCDFYDGYPLVLSPEAIDLVYLPQCQALLRLLESDATSLGEPGWFWHDFPDRRWADSVRRLPGEEPVRFQKEMRRMLKDAIRGETPTPAPHYTLEWLEFPLPSAVLEPPAT